MRYVVSIDIELPEPNDAHISADIKGLEHSLRSRMPTMKLLIYTGSDIPMATPNSRALISRQKRQAR